MLSDGHQRGHRVHHAVAVGRVPYRHRVMHRLARRPWFGLRYTVSNLFRRPLVRRLLLGAAICVFLAIVGVLGLWWRLSSGPIELDLATPWLKAAIEENFGGNHSVVVGGTQLERDEKGRTSLRLRDIVVRDADGTIVASAPKAEVGLSGRSLLVGQLRAQSLNLVGAEMAVRIETDGRLTVFAGADKRPIATATANSNISSADQPASFRQSAGRLACRVREARRHHGVDRCARADRTRRPRSA